MTSEEGSITSSASKWTTGSRNIRHTIFSQAILESFKAEMKGDALAKLGKEDLAQASYDRLLEIEEEFIGEEHPMLLAFHEKLDKEEGWEKTAIRDASASLAKAIKHEKDGNQLRKLGQNDKAKHEYEKVYKIEAAVLGEDHPMTIAMREKINRE
jgi:predicted negative regulator of RcsB-dependent stress response